MKKKKKKKTGPARMKELGNVAVTMWLTPDQARELDEARGRSPRASYAKMLLGQGIRGILQFRLPA